MSASIFAFQLNNNQYIHIRILSRYICVLCGFYIGEKLVSPIFLDSCSLALSHEHTQFYTTYEQSGGKRVCTHICELRWISFIIIQTCNTRLKGINNIILTLLHIYNFD